MALSTALRRALNRGISSGGLVDTKIVLYSRRDSSGRVCRPKALYTNSRVLKTVPYFEDLLFGNFAESQSKNFRDAVDEEDSAEDYGYMSDSDLEDDGDETISFGYNVKSVINHPSDPFAVPGEDPITREDYEERIERGKVVKIPDIAFVTFQAFLMYLYTDVIEFAPFGSDENRRSRRAEVVKSSDDKIPRPSPKSIYRLADKYDIPKLKALALNHIRGGLAKCDIIEELFSIFASRYDEVRNLYLEQLAFVWMDDSTTEAARAKVEEKIDSFVEGDLEYATEALSALWEIANKDGDVKAPSSTTPAATPVATPEHWASVKMALVKSIRQGVFFDRKYWARSSKTGNMLKPVYFSSIIMKDKARQLDKLVKHLKNEDPPVSDPEGDINLESDCDLIEPAGNNYNVASGTSPLWGRVIAVPTLPSSQPVTTWPQGDRVQPSLPEKAKPQPPHPWGFPPPSTPETAKPQPKASASWGQSLKLETAGSQPKPLGGWARSLMPETSRLPLEDIPMPIGLTPDSDDWKLSPVPGLPASSTPILTVTQSTPVTPVPIEDEVKPTIISSKGTKKGRNRFQERTSEPVRQPTPGEFVAPLKKPVQKEDPFEVIDEPWNTQENEERVRAVLVTGSFSAWKSLFFYRCTDKILFAPLNSQGVASRWKYIRENTVAATPPPCSPKSIYVLADLLGIPLLREKALEDIKKKVTSTTVVGEVFSWVAAGQKEILEMECDLLVSNFKGPNTLALVKQNIKHISEGSSSHCAGALKLGLEKAFKRKIQSNRVKLRCSYSSCTWYNNHVSYSAIGSGAYYCQVCVNRGWNHYLQCVGCGNNRTSNYASCQSCGKNFV